MSATILIGADTPLLVARSLADHPAHANAQRELDQRLEAGATLALCPIVINEFIHVVTDARRFERPLQIAEALRLARTWCESRETVVLYPSDESLRLQFDWLQQHRLGRKRLHDTHIAAIYYLAGAKTILTSTARDFSVFDCFETCDLVDNA